jgi:NAD(P)-dependent dehydrogenase (short-subunit alcohol dehydrogenase family)/GNAT superfamily N-acetyltransferase
MIEIRELARGELARVYAIDDSDDGDVVYEVAAGRLKATPVEWHRPWRTPERWNQSIALWEAILDQGGVVYGALLGDLLVGVAVLRPHLAAFRAQLQSLFVSRAYRRQGVARRLVGDVERRATADGARELYVSAVPSVPAVGFYLAQGFRVAEEVDPDLFAQEPEDIHLVKALLGHLDRRKETNVKELGGKVAVVTGAASGIGFAMAERFAAEGMKVVLADVEGDALARAEAELRGRGATVLAVRTDVRQASEVDALAEKTLAAFDEVHVVCNNAGVYITKFTWEHTLADWEWVLGVNLWGVIHGVRTFVPIMLRQGTEGHIVNTASEAGLTSGAILGSYCVSKFGVVALSESLAEELARLGAPIKVSVLCPNMVRTNLMTSARNRPRALTNPEEASPVRPEVQRVDESLRRGFEDTGILPAQVADRVVAAIRADTFYILTHPVTKEEVRVRMENILEGRNPGA